MWGDPWEFESPLPHTNVSSQEQSTLQITSEPIDPCQVRLTLVIAPEEVEAAKQAVAQDLARRQRIPGYRPGKVPYARIAAVVGDDALLDEAVERLAQRKPLEALRAEKLVPAAPMTLETVSRDPLTMRLVVPLAADVDLGPYHDLRVPAPPLPPVDDATVDAQIEAWRAELAEQMPVDRPAVAGDVVRVALTGRLGDDVVVEREAFDLALTGEAAVEAGLPATLPEHLVGVGAGESAAFEVTYSEVWPDAALQGRTVSFEAAVAEVRASVAPPLDDAFAARLGMPDLEALREQLRKQLASRAAMDARDEQVTRAVDALVDQARVRFAPQMLEHETRELAADLRQRVEQQGFTWERWLAMQTKEEDSLWADLEQQAEARLRRTLVLQAFAEAEGIGVEKGEVEGEVDRFSALFLRGGPRRRWKMDRDALRRELGARLFSGRTLGRLLAIVSGEDAAVPTADGAEPPPAAALEPAAGQEG